MKIIEINDEDITFINFAYSLINSARYPSFEKVTSTYNKIFGKNLSNTSCGSCIRQRILEMKDALDKLNNDICPKEKKETKE